MTNAKQPTRALLVIDVQESFRADPAAPPLHDQHIAAQVARLVAAARADDELVVWVLHSEPGTGTVFDPGLGYVRVMAELSPAAGEPVVVKTSINAFTSTNLQQQLVRAGIRDLVVCGIRTEQCCETTTRIASDLGFAVTFVTDATTTSPIADLEAAQLIARTETVLRERGFATIATTDDIVAGTSWRSASVAAR